MAELPLEKTPQATEEIPTEENKETESPQAYDEENIVHSKPNKCCGIFVCARHRDTEENGQGANLTTYGYMYNIFLHWRNIIVVLTPSILLPLLFMDKSLNMQLIIIISTMGIYWLTQAIPLPITALLPVIFFPILGIEGTQETSIQYIKPASILFMGTIILCQSIEVCHLHERICLKMILLIGTSPKLLMLGIMLSTMFISMWIPNTAATTVIVPIIESIKEELNKNEENATAIQKSQNEYSDQETNEVVSINTTKEAVNKEGDSEHIQSSENDGYTERDMSSLQANTVSQIITSSQETKGLYLAVAYASSIGGTGTVIGTGVNIALFGIIEMIFPETKALNFGTWMLFSIPNMLMCTLMGWLLLQLHYMKLFRGAVRKATKSGDIHEIVVEKYKRLGIMTYHEYTILIIFITGILFFICRSPKFFKGWADEIKENVVKDATSAMVLVILLQILPATTEFMHCNLNGGDHRVSPNLIAWKLIQEKMPWGLLILIGGGFCLTHGIQVTGLALTLEEKLASLSHLHPLILLCLTSVIATCLTQVAPNISTANILLPITGYLSKAIKKHPFYLMIPTAFCCSFSFLLPVGSPSNGIVYLVSNLKKIDMVKSGFIMCLISITVTIISINTLGWVLFDLKNYLE